MKFNGFMNSQGANAIAGALDVTTSALGWKPTYQNNNNVEKSLTIAEGISKNFGNPLVNAAGDAVAGGVGKAMGLHTNKMVGGGTQGVNAVSNVLSQFGPIGMIASGVLKVGNMAFGKNLLDFKED